MMDIVRDPRYWHGILRLDTENDSIRPVRFTDAEIEFYSVSKARRCRACSPAGVSLRFVTDASSVTVDLEVLDLARCHVDFGLVVDGIARPALHIPVSMPCGIRSVIPLDGARHEVWLYLPHLTECLFRSVEIDGSFCDPVPEKKLLWFCYGDSITQGMESADPAAIYPVLTADLLGCELIDFGVGGATFLAGELEPNGRKPDFVTAAYGINDWLTSKQYTPAEFSDNLHAYCDRLTKLFPDIPLFVISPFYAPHPDLRHSLGTFEELQDRILAVLKEYPAITPIDGRTLAPQDVACFNGVHPNELGFARIALNLYAILRRNLPV